MAGFKQENNSSGMRAVGEWAGLVGLGIIAAVDIAVVHHCMKNEAVDNLIPVVGAGVGVVAVGVALMMADTPRK